MEQIFNPNEKFAAKHIGANLIVTIGKEKYNKKISKEDAASIIKKMEAYNKKPSESKKKIIVKEIAPETVKKREEKEATEAKVKGLKKAVKKATKKEKTVEKADEKQKDIFEQLKDVLVTDPEAVAKLKALLKELTPVEEAKPQPVVASVRRGGEH